MPFMLKPYVPFAAVVYVRLVTFTPRSGVMKNAPPPESC
jgi:hypothetical protein